jgi:2-succinyl-5-enolpyruvyl-6-hydroxy-3-cyclohexene-1-carboxylate synthase
VASDDVQADATDLLDRVGTGSGGGPVPEGDGLEVDASPWCALWSRAGEAAAEVVAADGGPAFEGTILAETAAAVPPGGHLFVSSSMPVRDLDAFVPPRPGPLHVRGNRGASGIDGILSTVLGVRMTTAGPMTAVVGDLAFYHDMNGLLALRNVAPDLVLVVIQNDGGGIFHMLPIREYEPDFTPYFATPHGLDYARAAALYDIPHRLVPTRRGAVQDAVADALKAGGPWILEVRTDREENRRRHEEVVAAVTAGVESALQPEG